MNLINYVTVPIYGTVALLDSQLSEYDRDIASLDTTDGERVNVLRTEDGNYYCTTRNYNRLPNKSHYSEVYVHHGHYYRFNLTECVVQKLHKAKDFDKGLFEITDDGFAVVDSVGLSKEHWLDQEVRDEYLSEWEAEIAEEMEYLMSDIEAEFSVLNKELK